MFNLRSDEYIAFIDKLVSARQKAGLTQKEAAEKLQKPQSYISKIETCQRRVDGEYPYTKL